MSNEEVRQYYPNITCIESGGSVQYVINNPDDNNAQFESQQILVSSDQHIVLNTVENQHIIIDQSQLQYAQPNQQYIVQENEMVADYQPTEVVNNQQQIYYASPQQPKQQIIQQTTQSPILAQAMTSPQVAQRVVTQHLAQNTVKQMVPQQQIQNPHLMVQRRITVPPSPQVVQQRQIQQQPQNVGVRLQYTPNPPQQPQAEPSQLQQLLQNEDQSQLVLYDGRYMTLGQLRQELAQRGNENQRVVVTHQGVQQTPPEKPQPPYKAPAPKRNYKRNNNTTPNNRGRGRGAPQQNSPVTPKPFQVVNSPQQQIINSPQQQKQVLQYAGPRQRPPAIQPPRSPIIIPNLPAQLRQQLLPQQPQITQQQMPQQQMPPQQQMVQQQQLLQNRGQPLIPLSPHVQNGHLQHPVQQQSPAYSPPNSQGQQSYLDDSSSSMSDEYRDSARMLVCLENGEQRLITFTLPKESCTVQDLLEQVGVQFTQETKIECISNPGSEIDYIVNVGAVCNAPLSIDAQQVLTVENLNETQECVVSQTGAVIPVSEPSTTVPPPTPTIKTEPESEPERVKTPEPPKILPKFIPGFLAVCHHCGLVGEDFSRCHRCKKIFPDNVRRISVKSDIKDDKKSPKMSLASKPAALPKAIVGGVPAGVSPPAKPSPKTPGRKKKAVPEIEPVVLTLSSDEEDNVPKTSVSSRIFDNPVTLSAIQKEPVISELFDISLDSDLFNGNGKDDNSKPSVAHYTTLPCRTVRIGSYRFVPSQEVSLTSSGVTIGVPVLGDTAEIYKLFIPTQYIIKVLGNFSKALPVLFFYVTPSIGSLIRKNIKMEAGSEFYFDPLSKDDPFKRITLLPEVVTEDTKETIKSIYMNTPYKMLEELTAKEANDILIRTCPREGLKPAPTPSVSFTEMRQLLIYPPAGIGGIAINAEDYLCLAQDQFLNDVIIDFYLKYLVTDVLAPSMQSKVHIFSSFFYRRLTTKPAKASKRQNLFEVDPKLSPAEKRHCRVKTWTKTVNIFEKDYIIIPINESSHWFLAIICFPGLDGCRSMIDNKVVKIPTKEKKKINTITIGSTTITTVLEEKTKTVEKPIKCEEDEESDRDEAEADESELEESENESEHEEVILQKKGKDHEPIKQPCILIFDSLAGASRCRVVATLRDYLTYEHRAKLKSNKTFNKDVIKGHCPKVPQQMNFTDCGLYVLQYVESFFKDPILDYSIPIKQLKNWFEEITVTRKREDISNLIKELMADNNKDPSILPDIQFPTLNGELITNMDANFEEEEMEEEEEEEEEIPLEKTEENSLTQISASYNSDPESPVKCETSASTTSTTTFIVSNSAATKPDLSELKFKSNRDTMEYLKSKRIQRHRNLDDNNKKQKIDN